MLCLSGFELYSRWVPLYERGNIWRKTEYSINPQMHLTRSEFVSPYKTKSTTNDMHWRDFLKLLPQKRFLRDHYGANNL